MLHSNRGQKVKMETYADRKHNYKKRNNEGLTI